MTIILDTFAAGSVAKRPGYFKQTTSDKCHKWVIECEAAGHQVLVPAIVFYEALREMEMRQAEDQIQRLKNFCLQPHRYIHLTNEQLELAAKLWGRSRRIGLPTADRHALDCDVILAAQALSLGIEPTELIVATTNPAHISRYVAAELWSNIQP